MKKCYLLIISDMYKNQIFSYIYFKYAYYVFGKIII
jgi:hypothetical protein